MILLTIVFVADTYAQQSVRWQSDLEAAKQEAQQTNRLILVHYWATWCPACYRMEREVFIDQAVASAVNDSVIPVKLNFDHYQVDARSMGVSILPTDVVISPNGDVVGKLPGFAKPMQYVSRLNKVCADGRSRLQPGQPLPPSLGQIPISRPDGLNRPTEQRTAAQAPQQPATQQPVGSIAAQTGAVDRSAPTSEPADYLGDRYAEYRGNRYAAAQPVQHAPQYAVQPQPQMQPQPQPQPQIQPQPQPVQRQFTNKPVDRASQNQAAQAATGPSPPQFGLDGFCPVTLVEKKAWKFGDRRWGAVHLGITYLFSGLEEQQKFLKNPDRYSPVCRGNDIVMLLEKGQSVPGARKHGVSFAGRIYLFSSQDSLDAFTKEPRRYIAGYSQLTQANRPHYGQGVR